MNNTILKEIRRYRIARNIMGLMSVVAGLGAGVLATVLSTPEVGAFTSTAVAGTLVGATIAIDEKVGEMKRFEKDLEASQNNNDDEETEI